MFIRRLNKSPATLDEKDVLKKMLTEPPVKKIDLHFPLGLEVTARNLKGVTIKDGLDAIHKQFKKKVCNVLSFIFKRKKERGIRDQYKTKERARLIRDLESSLR